MPSYQQPPRRVARPVSSAVSASTSPDVANVVGGAVDDTANRLAPVLTGEELRHRTSVLLGQAGEASAANDEPRIARRLVSVLTGLLAMEPQDADATTRELAEAAPSTVAILLASELRGAEEDASSDGPAPDQSTAALLVYALGGAEIGAAAGLSALAASMLFAAQSVGLDVAAETIATAERFSTVAAELIRRERAGRAAELAASRAAAKEAARLAALPVRDPIADARDVAAVEGAADDLRALAAEVRARGIGGRRGAARATARLDAARSALFAARGARSSPRFIEGMRLETTLAVLLAGGAS